MSSDTNLEKAICDAIKTCTTNQSMIDITSKHLEELRTQCSSTDKFTQIEIKEAESKLIRMVGNQLVAKQKLNMDVMPEALRDYPKLELWLKIVGIPEDAVKEILEKGLSFSDLLYMEKDSLKSLLRSLDCSELEVKTLLTAFDNLRACTEKQLEGQTTSEHDWHFTDLVCLQAAAVAATAASRSSTNSPLAGNSPKQQQQQVVSPASSVPSAETYSTVHLESGSERTGRGRPPPLMSKSVTEMTPPRSTPSSPTPSPHIHNGSPPSNYSKPVSSPAMKYPMTPSYTKGYKLFADSTVISKSKSHESQLANKVVDIDPIKNNKKIKPSAIKLGGSHEILFKRRQSTDGSETGSRGPSGHTSPVIASPIRSPPYKHDPNAVIVDDNTKYSHTLTVPKSPKTPLKIHHQIYHRFANTFKITTCDYCHKQMILGFKCKDCKLATSMFVLAPCDVCMTFAIWGKSCKNCKKKFHKDCAQRAPPTCGLSDAAVDALIDWPESPITPRRFAKMNAMSSTWDEGLKPVISMPAILGGHLPDSGSSSCNSSSPSSPAHHQTSSDTITSPSPAPSPYKPRTQFSFPDVASTLPADFGSGTGTDSTDIDVVNTNVSNDSDKTLIDSNTSEHTLPDRVDSVDSQDDPLGCNRRNSLAAGMKEWDIPFEDLYIMEAIGKGRIGTVYKGVWHGDVAIKVVDTGSSYDNESQVAAFKLEIAILRKTRHENLVLFMGACMTPPNFAIVTRQMLLNCLKLIQKQMPSRTKDIINLIFSFCKGQTLYTMIHLNKNVFKINKAIVIASQIAQGISYLHARGIIHKDLRTKNIFIDSGRVVITDFGLFHVTRLCRGTKKDNWLSVPKGWLCYLAPEIIRSLKAMQQSQSDLPFTKMSDLYAFGTVWYELLCNDWPFRSQPCETIIWQVGRGIKQSLSTMNAPREVKEILISCWAFHAGDRPDFAQIAKALDRIPRTRLIRSPSHPCQLSRSLDALALT